MNLSEFKAWFEGFTESFDRTPNEKQWKRIKEKIDKIEDAPPVTIHKFYDHYYQPWRRWYGTFSIGGSDTDHNPSLHPTWIANSVASAQQIHAQSTTFGVNKDCVEFDSASAFRALGQAEARSICHPTK